MNPVDEKKGFSKKQIVSWAGTALMIASMVFLVRRLLEFSADIDIAFLTSWRVVSGLIVVALLESAGILFAAVNFRALVKNVSGVLVERPLGLVVYTISNLYKYIPGGVMYVVGRNRLAVETEDLGHPEVALSTVLEGALVAIAAILIVIITVRDHALEYLRQEELPVSFYMVLAAILIIVCFVVFMLRNKIANRLKKLFGHMRVLKPVVLLWRFGFAILLMVFWGGTFLATLVVMGQPMTRELAPTVIGLFLLSWVAGFLTPGAPSGLGIREFVMVTFMGGVVNDGVLISAMFIHRVLAAAGDAMAYGIAVGYAHLMRSK